MQDEMLKLIVSKLNDLPTRGELAEERAIVTRQIDVLTENLIASIAGVQRDLRSIRADIRATNARIDVLEERLDAIEHHTGTKSTRH